MNRLKIQTYHTITIDDKVTGYYVHQTPDRTVVEQWHNNRYPVPFDFGKTVTMPAPRYALGIRKYAPPSGIPNRNDFDQDMLAIWDRKSGD
jgi:hypothetical protein|tara:strand:+ start:1178 stop:1450 length:273 start_codon:yes stop_codon:yes gene_type:complete